MKALIVEDEKRARELLARVITSNYEDIEIVGMTDSVTSTIDFLTRQPQPEIIFMDVELLDGDCFEIFRQIKVRSQVIMTTAYDSYAIKAFEAGSVDYLLKPIGLDALDRAVGRCRERIADAPAAGINVDALMAAIDAYRTRTETHCVRKYRERFTVKSGDRIIPISTDDAAFFFSEDKSNYLMTVNGEKYIVESSIEQLSEELDPLQFFRASRGCIISRRSITSATRHLSGRLILATEPHSPIELSVSRSRADDFLNWLE